MPRRKGDWSSTTYSFAAKKAATLGSATHEGELRVRQGRGMDPLVNPSEHGVIRLAQDLLIPNEKGQFVLAEGISMPIKTDLDTTGSMGGNIDVAFDILPKVQNLLVQGTDAVLARYHTQIATGAVQDVVDSFPYQVSQFEPDNEVERQMGLLYPERSGGDSTEDYQIALFSTAYLTQGDIRKHGLKGYYFVVGDEIGRDVLDLHSLTRVFGSSVMEKAFESGQQPSSLSTMQVVHKVMQDWHVFFLQVDNRNHTTRWWSGLLGRERVIALPRTQDLAEIQACIIGLTEGVLDLQTAAHFLKGSNDAERIIRAVSQIPLAAQANLPNFNQIPMAGSVFDNREDVWLANGSAEKIPDSTSLPRSEIDWKL